MSLSMCLFPHSTLEVHDTFALKNSSLPSSLTFPSFDNVSSFDHHTL